MSLAGWKGCDGMAPDAALEPEVVRLDLSYGEEQLWEETSRTKTAADKRRIFLHAQSTVHEPHWL